MSYNNLKSPRLNLSALRYWLTPIAIIWLLSFVGLGWLVKSFLVLTVLILLTPIAIFFGFRWWVRHNLIQASCPVCQYQFTALNQTQLSCPNCKEQIKVEQGNFQRPIASDVIDVQAVEVTATKVD